MQHHHLANVVATLELTTGSSEIAITFIMWCFKIILKLFTVTLLIMFEKFLIVDSDFPWIYFHLHANYTSIGIAWFTGLFGIHTHTPNFASRHE